MSERNRDLEHIQMIEREVLEQMYLASTKDRGQLEAERDRLKNSLDEAHIGYRRTLIKVAVKHKLDSERLDKLERMSPATLGEVLCRLAKPSAKVRDVIDKLEEQESNFDGLDK